MTLLRIVFAAALLVWAVPAQNATFTNFGVASGNTSAGQQIVANGLPQIGTTFTLGVDYTTPPFFCPQVITPYAVWLVLGFSNQTWLGLPLPLTMPQGFDLLVSADAVAQTSVVNGNGCPPGSTNGQGPTFPVVIPNNAGLIGLQFHAQILMSRSNGSLIPIATNGGTATIGI